MNIIEKLQNGETIPEYREGGNSMRPIIKHREAVTLRPIRVYESLQKGDIVLVKVNGRRYTHLISATKPGHVQISNNRGHVNGWAPHRQVYGIVTEIEGAFRRNSQYHASECLPKIKPITEGTHGIQPHQEGNP